MKLFVVLLVIFNLFYLNSASVIINPLYDTFTITGKGCSNSEVETLNQCGPVCGSAGGKVIIGTSSIDYIWSLSSDIQCNTTTNSIPFNCLPNNQTFLVGDYTVYCSASSQSIVPQYTSFTITGSGCNSSEVEQLNQCKSVCGSAGGKIITGLSSTNYKWLLTSDAKCNTVSNSISFDCLPNNATFKIGDYTVYCNSPKPKYTSFSIIGTDCNSNGEVETLNQCSSVCGSAGSKVTVGSTSTNYQWSITTDANCNTVSNSISFDCLPNKQTFKIGDYTVYCIEPIIPQYTYFVFSDGICLGSEVATLDQCEQLCGLYGNKITIGSNSTNYSWGVTMEKQCTLPNHTFNCLPNKETFKIGDFTVYCSDSQPLTPNYTSFKITGAGCNSNGEVETLNQCGSICGSTGSKITMGTTGYNYRWSLSNDAQCNTASDQISFNCLSNNQPSKVGNYTILCYDPHSIKPQYTSFTVTGAGCNLNGEVETLNQCGAVCGSAGGKITVGTSNTNYVWLLTTDSQCNTITDSLSFDCLPNNSTFKVGDYTVYCNSPMSPKYTLFTINGNGCNSNGEVESLNQCSSVCGSTGSIITVGTNSTNYQWSLTSDGQCNTVSSTISFNCPSNNEPVKIGDYTIICQDGSTDSLPSNASKITAFSTLVLLLILLIL